MSRIRGDPETVFRMGEEKLRAEHEEWVEEPFPAGWPDASRLVGFSVPAHASAQGTWDVSFECLAEEGAHHFTCWFEDGVPVSVSVDG